MIYMPDVAALDQAVMSQVQQCDVLLLDGTFWSNHEMQETGAGRALAEEMGHLPIGGIYGSLARIASLPMSRRIYIHINNTNPLHVAGSPERRKVEGAGWEVAADGMEIVLC